LFLHDFKRGIVFGMGIAESRNIKIYSNNQGGGIMLLSQAKPSQAKP
jgi:hypothetical protein